MRPRRVDPRGPELYASEGGDCSSWKTAGGAAGDPADAELSELHRSRHSSSHPNHSRTWRLCADYARGHSDEVRPILTRDPSARVVPDSSRRPATAPHDLVSRDRLRPGD